MPRIRIEQYEDWDEIDEDFREQERVFRRPKEERDAGHKKAGHKYNPDAARRKEYDERDS